MKYIFRSYFFYCFMITRKRRSFAYSSAKVAFAYVGNRVLSQEHCRDFHAGWMSACGHGRVPRICLDHSGYGNRLR